jgi:hypothetical protein
MYREIKKKSISNSSLLLLPKIKSCDPTRLIPRETSIGDRQKLLTNQIADDLEHKRA